MKHIILPCADFASIVNINNAFFFRYNVSEANGNSEMLEAEECAAVVPNATYSTLVSAFIHTKYSIDDELAILANHAADPNNAEHLTIYNEYQAWREEVKVACREYFHIDN